MAMMVSVRYHVYASNARADFAEETVRADEGLMNKDCITVSIRLLRCTSVTTREQGPSYTIFVKCSTARSLEHLGAAPRGQVIGINFLLSLGFLPDS